MQLFQNRRLIDLLRIILLCIGLVGAQVCDSSDPASGLNTADLSAYALFAGSGYTFSGGVNSTTITGNIASYPTASPLNGNSKVILIGTEQLSASVTSPVAAELRAVYNNALAKAPRNSISGNIGGTTLNAGVYYSQSTILVTGNVTLDAQNDASAVFLIIAGSATTFSTNSQVLLVNGAQCCRVFWVFGSSGTVDTNAMVVGNMIADVSVSVGSGSTVIGSLFALSEITLNNNTVSLCSCSLSSSSLAQCTSAPSTASTPPVASSTTVSSTSSTTGPAGSTSASSTTSTTGTISVNVNTPTSVNVPIRAEAVLIVLLSLVSFL